MKAVVLYENKLHRETLKESIESAGHNVELVVNSNDFIEAIYDNSADVYVLDVQSWFRGASIYNYYDIPSKMRETKVVFFNTPEGFSAIDDREALDVDVVVEGFNRDFEEIATAIA